MFIGVVEIKVIDWNEGKWKGMVDVIWFKI